MVFFCWTTFVCVNRRLEKHFMEYECMVGKLECWCKLLFDFTKCLNTCNGHQQESVGGVKVSIVAFQAIDLGSIPSRRIFLDLMFCRRWSLFAHQLKTLQLMQLYYFISSVISYACCCNSLVARKRAQAKTYLFCKNFIIFFIKFFH